MAELSGNVRVGNVILYNNGKFKVLKRQHVQPGKGGAFYQIEMKEIKTGQKMNVRFRSEDKVDIVNVNTLSCQVLYLTKDTVHLMDQQHFDQLELPLSLAEEAAPFLREEMIVEVETADDEPVSIKLPNKIIIRISETDPYVKNQTVTASYKQATLENGIQIKVPPFLGSGQNIIVSLTYDDSDNMIFVYDGKAD